MVVNYYIFSWPSSSEIRVPNVASFQFYHQGTLQNRLALDQRSESNQCDANFYNMIIWEIISLLA